MPSKTLFDEAMQPIKERYPSNYDILMRHPLEKWTHHATDSNLVVQDSVTSNNAESTIAMVGAEVGVKMGCLDQSITCSDFRDHRLF